MSQHLFLSQWMVTKEPSASYLDPATWTLPVNTSSVPVLSVRDPFPQLSEHVILLLKIHVAQ